jgi:phosphate starvation-inducible PhoH-like protein
MARKKTNGNHYKPHIEYLNAHQKLAYGAYQQHDIVILLGPAGTGKTFLATAFAVTDILEKARKKIVLTRPVLEAGEKLGYLPGTLEEKINPYLMPIFDCMQKFLHADKESFDKFIENYIEIAPIAFMRGRNFTNSVCIFDEAQNATFKQLKLFLTRLDENSKIIITGDPKQSDLDTNTIPLLDVVHRVERIAGVSVVRFNEESIVRHPLVAEIVKSLEDYNG